MTSFFIMSKPLSTMLGEEDGCMVTLPTAIRLVKQYIHHRSTSHQS